GSKFQVPSSRPSARFGSGTWNLELRNLKLLLGRGLGGRGRGRGGGRGGRRAGGRPGGSGALGTLDRFLLRLLLQDDLLDAGLGQPERALAVGELAVLHHLEDALGPGQYAPLPGQPGLALEALVDGHRSVSVGVSVVDDRRRPPEVASC